MAKKGTVIYCKFCDDVLETDIIKKSGNTFCSQACCGAWTKTHQSPTDETISMLKQNVQRLKDHKFDKSQIKLQCSANYNSMKAIWEQMDDDFGTSKKEIGEQVKMFAYIYNGNKKKFEEAFQRWKKMTQDDIDGMLFDGKEMMLMVMSSDTKPLTGEESLRVYSIIVKLKTEYFSLLAQF
jgi:hypothetical protein